MDRSRRTSTLRRVAMMAGLAALLVPAAPAEAASKAKAPTVTKVSPLKAAVGDTLTITGTGFRKGKGRNSVGFKAEGQSIVYAKADVSTTKRMYVKVPAALQDLVAGGARRFRLRVLAARYSRSYTSTKLSPVIRARSAAGAGGGTAASGATGAAGSPAGPGAGTSAAAPDCDGDGTPDASDADDDDDLLPDALEEALGTARCAGDSDGDGLGDGWEYQSAVDLNDDEYRSPQSVLPYPGARPFPNPLYADDADTDFDGDGLTDAAEHALWTYSWQTVHTAARTLAPLSYSGGEQYSVNVRDSGGHRSPALPAAGYERDASFVAWAAANGYRTVDLVDRSWTGFTPGLNSYGLFDADRLNGEDAGELAHLDLDGDGFLSDNERDEDADGLTNYDETVGRMTPGYWKACYTAEPAFAVSYPGTSATDPDLDRDGVRDGADDQDHDDVPNVAELSRWDASHIDDTDDGVNGSISGGGRTCVPDSDLDATASRHAARFGRVNPFNPCFPDAGSRTCPKVVSFGTGYGPNWWSLQ